MSTTAIITPRTSAGSSSASLSSQKNSGIAANLTQTLVKSSARAQTASPRSASSSLAIIDPAEMSTTAR